MTDPIRMLVNWWSDTPSIQMICTDCPSYAFEPATELGAQPKLTVFAREGVRHIIEDHD